MEPITIREFQLLTKLSHREVLTMLEHGELATVQGDGGKLLIDVENLSPEDIARRSPPEEHSMTDAEHELHSEVIASEVIATMEHLIDEALELALKWIADRTTSDEPSST